MTSVGNNAFHYCSSVTSATLPSSLTRIGDMAFATHYSLKSLTIPDNVTTIGSYAFEYCDKLTSLAIPDNVTSIGYGAFSGCHKLTEITVGAQNNNYVSEDGVLFNKGKTKLIFCPVNKSGAYEIPASVTSIGEYAFEDCKGLTSVTLPDGVTSIGDAAFFCCLGLKSVNIPDGVTSIGRVAFSDCHSLTSLTIPDSVTSIGEAAFYGCSGLTSIIIPDSITSIEDSVFVSCYGLTSITFPDGLTSIGKQAFYKCDALKSVTFPASLTTIGSGAFLRATHLKTAVFMGDAPTIIGDAPPFIDVASDFCIYYADGAKGWTPPPTWTSWAGKTYPCKPLSQMNPDKPTPPVTPSDPGTGGDTPITPSNPEPTVETETAPDGTVTTTTTWTDGKKAVQEKTPDGGAKVEVTSSTGETIAKVELPANPGAGKDFEDVKEGAWYEGAVDKATAYGLFNGQTETTFAPNGNMTRGMVAQVLYNLSGKTGYGAGSGNFTDVAAGKWYENAIDWAAKAEIVSGTGNGSFSPEQPVTREQLVTMLYRYAQAIGTDTKASAGLGSFPDGNSVSDYAKTAMQWAVAEGFISGRNQNGGKYIAPNGTATRAEVAAVLTRFVEYLKK